MRGLFSPSTPSSIQIIYNVSAIFVGNIIIIIIIIVVNINTMLPSINANDPLRVNTIVIIKNK
jgi:hypothetical protein